MGKVVSCDECRKAYRSLEALEDLRDNDGICLVCNNPIEVEDWDRILASYDDDDFDDVDDELEDEDDFSEDEDEDGFEDGFDIDDDIDLADDDDDDAFDELDDDDD